MVTMRLAKSSIPKEFFLSDAERDALRFCLTGTAASGEATRIVSMRLAKSSSPKECFFSFDLQSQLDEESLLVLSGVTM